MAIETIQQVLENMEASDMFFNHEQVTDSYGQMLQASDNGELENGQTEAQWMARHLGACTGWNGNSCRIICEDFLARV